MAKNSAPEQKNLHCVKPLRPAKDAGRANRLTKHSSPRRKLDRVRHTDRSFGWWAQRVNGAAPKPQLLILGASGHVAQAVLLRLAARRNDFGQLILVDPNDRVTRNPHLDHGRLHYEFIQRAFQLPDDTPAYHELLRQKRINIVVDLTDLDTLPVLAATDEVGVTYVNTALNEVKRGIAEVLADRQFNRNTPRNAPHILSSGMNPGVVNLWVWHGFQNYGTPNEIIHFEYDTSVPVGGWQPIITWSRQEFLTEAVWDKTGQVINGALHMHPGNSLEHRESLESVMQPVMDLPEYPRGLLVLHEENVKLGAKLGASSKYVYAIHPKTMAYLEEKKRNHGQVKIEDLLIGNNTSMPLAGEDTIGVCLNYPDQRVYYLHRLANRDVTGTNATCAQVAVGMDAALFALTFEPLPPRVHFASDLYDTVYSDVAFAALRVEHSIFAKTDHSLVRTRHEPRLRPAPLVADTLVAG